MWYKDFKKISIFWNRGSFSKISFIGWNIFFTCFAINTNVIATLASNLEDNNKGDKAKSIIASIWDEKAKWENIHIQNDNKETKMELTKYNMKYNLAAIYYMKIIFWMNGLE